MKKTVLFFCCIFMPFLLHASEKLKAGLFQIVPYAYMEEGKLTGITHDIIQGLQNESNVTIETQLLPYKRMLNYLELGKIDFGIFFLSNYSESFSEKLIAMYDLDTIVIGKKSLKISSFDDLLKLRMATPLGVNYNAKLNNKKQLKITRVKDYKNAILMLDSNHIDALIGPRKIVEYQLKLLDMDIKNLGEPYILTTNTAWIQFSDQSKKSQYKDILIKAAKKLLESGRVDEITSMYYE